MFRQILFARVSIPSRFFGCPRASPPPQPKAVSKSQSIAIVKTYCTTDYTPTYSYIITAEWKYSRNEEKYLNAFVSVPYRIHNTFHF